MSKTTKDKDDRMTITVEKGEETVSFQTDPDLHISEFRDLMMRLAAAVGYHQSNIEEYFLPNEEKGECCGAMEQVSSEYNEPKEEQDTQSAKDLKQSLNEATLKNFKEAPSVDMGGNYKRDDTFV